MKRFLSVICAFIITLSCFAATCAFAEGEQIRGDVNSDGELNVIDVALVRAYITGSVKLSVQEFANAEMNSDGLVDIIDVAMMRNAIITGGGVYDESGLKISTTQLTLNKGACALVYVETKEPDKLRFTSSSDYFEIKSGMNVDKNLIAVAVFVNEAPKTDTTEKIQICIEGNENNSKYVDVTVMAKENLAEYYNHPNVPDFGTTCGISPVDVAIDGTTYSYYANQIAEVFGEKGMTEIYNNYGDILEDYGYTFKVSYDVTGGGEIINYVSHDKTIGIEFGSVPNPDDTTQWLIVVGITEIK